MRDRASVLHLDLDAFYASVEQRDKPSLRGKAVVVGGVGARGVVATASYEARVFGVRSAMSGSEARRRAPHAAFLAGRFDAYRQSSRIVMALLHELSPLVEALSLDEAFVDLAAGGQEVGSTQALAELAERIRADVTERTEGLTCSIGIGSSKFMAKVASELGKPDGVHVVEPGSEVATIAPLPIRAIPGVGPVSGEKLTRLGITTVADLQNASLTELNRELGPSWAAGLHDFAFARDDRPVSADREAKSISIEDTFATDISDRAELEQLLVRDAERIVRRMQRRQLFARTVSIKVRFGDFTTITRARSLSGGTDSAASVAEIGRQLLAGVDVRPGLRLLGIGVSGFTQAAQEELFVLDGGASSDETVTSGPSSTSSPATVQDTDRYLHRRADTWLPGVEVIHAELGRGWVWGAGKGRVTVRFETRLRPHGPVRSFATDDPELSLATDLLPLDWDVPEEDDRDDPPGPDESTGGTPGKTDPEDPPK